MQIGAPETTRTRRVDCTECYAQFAGTPCWELWSRREPASKPCCRQEPDCTTCPVFVAAHAPEPLTVAALPSGQSVTEIGPAPPRGTRVRPRREVRVCAYLRATLTSDRHGSVNAVTALRAALQTKESPSCRCTVRGVGLTADYVRTVCVSADVGACAFLGDDAVCKG